MDCLFCKIASKEIPSEVIYEDEFVLGFLDINPCTPGHAVVIPKTHAGNIIDLKAELVGPLFSAVKKLTEKLQKALSPQGFTIGINQGSMAGQAIDHLHIHIIPRYTGDGGGSLHSVVHFLGKESVREVAQKINSN